jgi:hypothetical protein
MFSASWQVGLIVGPVIGGVLYATDPPLAYVGSVALLLVDLFLRRVRVFDRSFRG